MKKSMQIKGTVGLALLAAMSLNAADTTTFTSKPGGKVRIEGTSTVHDWQAETAFIAGTLQAGPDFPKEVGQAVTPGKVNAQADVSVTVRMLKSVKKDGTPYDDKMDDVMWKDLKYQQYPKIIYRTTELVLKEAPKSKDAPYVFDSKGEMIIAGVTNVVSMPVNVMPLGNNKLKITGGTTVKMTDFGIQPPAPKLTFGLVKTGNDVKVIFEWMVAPKPAASAAK